MPQRRCCCAAAQRLPGCRSLRSLSPWWWPTARSYPHSLTTASAPGCFGPSTPPASTRSAGRRPSASQPIADPAAPVSCSGTGRHHHVWRGPVSCRCWALSCPESMNPSSSIFVSSQSLSAGMESMAPRTQRPAGRARPPLRRGDEAQWRLVALLVAMRLPKHQPASAPRSLWCRSLGVLGCRGWNSATSASGSGRRRPRRPWQLLRYAPSRRPS